MPTEILSVSQLNRSVRDLLEHRYPLLWVRGEISNFMVAKSGHAYFSLKDSQSQIRCAMFRNRFQYVEWRPADGMQVEVQGLVTLYEARGDYQLVVEAARRAGIGALYEAFLRLKDKLSREGLFEEDLKRPLPTSPQRIGVVTSLKAAALRDVLTTLSRRNPAIGVVIYPTTVQGESAAREITAAINNAGMRAECDVLLLCRGGGSIEDLWSFNDESVARAIRNCPIPVVTGIGHETDFTIADFAADKRAPTPTAAAELVSPSRAELLAHVSTLTGRIRQRTRRTLEIKEQFLDSVLRRLVHPARRLDERRQAVDGLATRLSRATASMFGDRVWKLRELQHRTRLQAPDLDRLAQLAASLRARLVNRWSIAARQRTDYLASLETNLAHLNPQRVLERGFSLVRDAGSGTLVRNSATLSTHQKIEITFAQGSALAEIMPPRTP